MLDREAGTYPEAEVSLSDVLQERNFSNVDWLSMVGEKVSEALGKGFFFCDNPANEWVEKIHLGANSNWHQKQTVVVVLHLYSLVNQ